MRSLAIRYALYLAAGLTALFLVSHFLGLSNRYDLRLLNGIIHLGISYIAIKKYLDQGTFGRSTFVAGTAMGMYVGVLGAALFSAFMCLFLSIDTVFMAELKESVSLGRYFTPVSASGFILMEGISVSLIGSYLLTRIIDAQSSPSESATA